jgi:hypothetical protein
MMNVYYKMAMIFFLIMIFAFSLFIYMHKYNQRLNSIISGENKRKIMDPSLIFRGMLVLIVVISLSLFIPFKTPGANIPQDGYDDSLNPSPDDNKNGEEPPIGIEDPNGIEEGSSDTTPLIVVNVDPDGFDLSQKQDIARIISEANPATLITYNRLGPSASGVHPDYDIEIRGNQVIINIVPSNEAQRDRIIELVRLIEDSIY